MNVISEAWRREQDVQRSFRRSSASAAQGVGPVRGQNVCLTDLLPGRGELRPGVSRQHVDDDHLAPLLHVHQQVAQLPVVLVDQVDAVWAHVLKGHDHAAGHQLQHTESSHCDVNM